MRASWIPLAVVMLLAVTACETKKTEKLTPGDRQDVVVNASAVTADAMVADQLVEIPDPADLTDWTGHNEALLTPHIGLTGLERHESTRIGYGNSFSQNEVPAPIVIDGKVIAMDAGGVVSAHEVADIDRQLWAINIAENDRVDEVLGGGFAVADGVVYATAGYGKLAAINLETGALVWSIRVGAPVRGAPAVASAEKRVVVLTADNQTMAFDTATGEARWTHRGIRESASYFSTTSPVISEGIVVACYTSGEVVALRVETGNALWNDTIATGNKTSASAAFNGIDADPIVQDGVVVVTGSSGQTQASALLNGRPLWQNKIGSHDTMWSAGNVVFALTTGHELVAMFKRDGSIRWVQSLAVMDSKNKDVTPALYGPILSGNAVMVVTAEGKLLTFRPQDGEPLSQHDIANEAASAPVIAGGALYLVTKDARLHKYY